MKERYRLIISHPRIKILPRHMRTIVGYLSVEELLLVPMVVKFLKTNFDIVIEIEHAPMEKK